MRLIKNSLICILFTVFSSIISIQAPTYHIAMLRFQLSPAVFLIKNQAGQGGTGFGITAESGKKFILTNKHVCGLPTPGANHTVNVQQGNTFFKRSIVALDRDHDLCLVEPVSDEIDTIIVGEEPEVGDSVTIIGHPLLTTLQISRGIYNGYTPLMEFPFLDQIDLPILVPVGWTNAASYPGNSGSPVVDNFGFLIGILFAGMGDHVNMIIPLHSIKTFLKRN